MQPPSPPRPRLNLDRSAIPEDEFFGVDDVEPAEVGPEPSLSHRSIAAPLVALGQRIGRVRRERELEREVSEIEVSEQLAPAWGEALDPEIEQHMIRLASNRSWEEFLAAEREESLFEVYERSQRSNSRASTTALLLAAMVMLVVAALGGADFLRSLADEGDTTLAFFSEHLPAADYPASIVVALLGPVFIFLALTQGLTVLLSGAAERRSSRLVIGALGSALALGALGLLAGGAFLHALVLAALVSLIMRALTIVARAAGVS